MIFKTVHDTEHHLINASQSQDNLMILSSSYWDLLYLASSDRDGQLSLHNQSVLIGCGSTKTHNAAWRGRREEVKRGRKKGGEKEDELDWKVFYWQNTLLGIDFGSRISCVYRLQLTFCKSRSVWELQHLADRFVLPWRWLPARGL